MRYAGKRVIATAFILMAFRQMISLFRFISQGTVKIDLIAEMIGLSISLLILYGVIAIIHYIKSKEENKDAAASAEMRYRTLFDQSPDGVLLMNAKGDIVDFNEAANQQLGYTHKEFSKLRIADIDAVGSPQEINARYDMATREGKTEFEAKHRIEGGKVIDIQVSGKGVGWAFATVYSVIQKHGGRIFTESKLGKGTTFTILLPASDAVTVPAKPMENAVHAGAGKILVMDDEADIRRLLATYWNVWVTVRGTRRMGRAQ